MAEKTMKVTVVRYRPEQDDKPWEQTFEVPYIKETSVLEALFYIKDHFEPSLSFRWSCRMAVCGSCGMMVNGVPHLACINCGCCYAACPQYKINKDFIGPAALTLLYRYNIDNRDGGQAQRMPFLNAEEGVWSCTFVGYCSEVCPKHVDPSSAIQLGKKMSATDYVIRMFKPE